jgi:hypothetical protein
MQSTIFNQQSFYMASWPSGKARVCKTLTTGSNPVDASKEQVFPALFLLPVMSSKLLRKDNLSGYIIFYQNWG